MSSSVFTFKNLLTVSCAVTFLQKGQGPEHLDFANPLYRDLLGLDASQNPHDLLLEQGINPVSDFIMMLSSYVSVLLGAVVM